MDALSIDNATVREYQIRRLGEIRSNRDENEVREALDCLKRGTNFSKDNDNDNNGIINRNNRKMATDMLGGGGGMRLASDRSINPRIY